MVLLNVKLRVLIQGTVDALSSIKLGHKAGDPDRC